MLEAIRHPQIKMNMTLFVSIFPVLVSTQVGISCTDIVSPLIVMNCDLSSKHDVAFYEITVNVCRYVTHVEAYFLCCICTSPHHFHRRNFLSEPKYHLIGTCHLFVQQNFAPIAHRPMIVITVHFVAVNILLAHNITLYSQRLDSNG